MIDPRELNPDQLDRVEEQLAGGVLASLLDSTILAPDATAAQVDKLVEEAARIGSQVCVNASRLTRAIDGLGEHRAKHFVSTVVGFPLGANTSAAKVAEAEEMLRLGADEIDMVANVGLLKDGAREDWIADVDGVAAELASYNLANGCRRVLKVIIECCLLSQQEKEFSAAAVAEVGRLRGIDIFVKTSTGFAKTPQGVPSGATLDDVLLLRRTVGDYDPRANRVGVKASGGIRDAATAVRMIVAAGAFDADLNLAADPLRVVRIGTSSAGAIASA